ncbi:MFS transporter [Morganella morganii]|uniref:MFS transporter n=1 Tax=Morganella morganii TaxID=582 RepID=UPI00052B5CE8|nr:MFS transporter [Morganella morganii]KGP42355.1 ribonucleoside transporter [Morganella morganii]
MKEKNRCTATVKSDWSAVFAVAFCVACLIIAEFLPVSLLTPIALDLDVSEGLAGQSVTSTALVAMFASLLVTRLIGGLNRRYVVIAFAVLLFLSSILVSLSVNFAMLLLGRAFLGLALGGFWAISTSLIMRLVEGHNIPKALSIFFGAVSIALVIAAPLGSFLGGVAGWRLVFNGSALMGGICALWLWYALPSLPHETSYSQGNLYSLLNSPFFRNGMIAIFLVFAGQFSFFTYVRPILMGLSGFDVDGLTLVLLAFGIASFVGSSTSSFFVRRGLRSTLAFSPIILLLCAAMLIFFGSNRIVAGLVMVIWGLVFAFIPVGWSVWITRNVSDQAEKAGSVQVATIQLANTCGAGIGGFAFDHLGLLAPVIISGGFMLLTALLVMYKVKIVDG